MFSLSEDGPESKRKSKALTPRWRARQGSKTEVTSAKAEAGKSNKFILWTLEATIELERDLWLSL